VPAHRMKKDYHRRWHRGHGVFCAMMRFLEATDQNGQYIIGEGPRENAVRLFGVPGYLYRQMAEQSGKWVLTSVRRQQALSFMHGNNIRFLVSYIRTRYRQERARTRRSAVAEVGTFATNLLRKKMRGAFTGGAKRPA